MLRVTPVRVLTDNYAYIIDSPCGARAVVDPGDADQILDFLGEKRLDLILLTHHHADHVGGAQALAYTMGVRIAGAAADAHRLPPLDIALREGEAIPIGAERLQVIETPGHTIGALAYHAPGSGLLFTGDTLFLGGCGRLFEGTAEQMFKSLQRLAELPPETLIYPGHEYTLANLTFCAQVEPENTTLYQRLTKLRAAGPPTVPATLTEELATNAFLRAPTAERFAALRALKDKI